MNTGLTITASSHLGKHGSFRFPLGGDVRAFVQAARRCVFIGGLPIAAESDSVDAGDVDHRGPSPVGGLGDMPAPVDVGSPHFVVVSASDMHHRRGVDHEIGTFASLGEKCSVAEPAL